MLSYTIHDRATTPLSKFPIPPRLSNSKGINCVRILPARSQLTPILLFGMMMCGSASASLMPALDLISEGWSDRPDRIELCFSSWHDPSRKVQHSHRMATSLCTTCIWMARRLAEFVNRDHWKMGKSRTFLSFGTSEV